MKDILFEIDEKGRLMVNGMGQFSPATFHLGLLLLKDSLRNSKNSLCDYLKRELSGSEFETYCSKFSEKLGCEVSDSDFFMSSTFEVYYSSSTMYTISYSEVGWKRIKIYSVEFSRKYETMYVRPMRWARTVYSSRINGRFRPRMKCFPFYENNKTLFSIKQLPEETKVKILNAIKFALGIELEE